MLRESTSFHMPKACPYKSVKALLWSDIVFSCTKFRLDPKSAAFDSCKLKLLPSNWRDMPSAGEAGVF